MRELAAKFRIDLALSVASDHAASFALLTAGAVDAFASDDVLLYTAGGAEPGPGQYLVVGEVPLVRPLRPRDVQEQGDARRSPRSSPRPSTSSPRTARSSGATPLVPAEAPRGREPRPADRSAAPRRSSARSRRPTSSPRPPATSRSRLRHRFARPRCCTDVRQLVRERLQVARGACRGKRRRCRGPRRRPWPEAP